MFVFGLFGHIISSLLLGGILAIVITFALFMLCRQLGSTVSVWTIFTLFVLFIFLAAQVELSRQGFNMQFHPNLIFNRY